MNKEPILVIMAAGMGSRYGGLKQIDPIGTNEELIIDFSIFDAIKAGFKKVVFIIKKEDEIDFKKAIGDRIAQFVETAYAYQDLKDLPKGYKAPSERTKPWGTGHAILACKEMVKEPFVVINADDYYGREAFGKMYTFLKNTQDDEKYRYGMVGYTLSNTLTEHGYVARGVCEKAENYLASICERTHIAYHQGLVQFFEEERWEPVNPSSIVSMNLWGFTPSIFKELEAQFISFLDNALVNNPLKAEYFLPTVVDSLIKQNKATVEILHSKDKWYGVTYKEDKPVVIKAIQGFQEEGMYPLKLWEENSMKKENGGQLLKSIYSQFKFAGNMASIEPTGNGHINDTFLVVTDTKKQYILQRINHHIFKDPHQLMENIEKVCCHIATKLEQSGGDVERGVLTLIKTIDGSCFIKDRDDYYWRAYAFITNTVSYDVVPSNEIFYNCAKAFGNFQKYLSDFDASVLHETIPYFHHTKTRFQNFLNALEKDAVGRAALVKEEIQFVIEHKADTEHLLDLYKAGKLPLRVTHNDTKINNVMVDEASHKGICVIDLDTVMPGLSAYDFGDCIRSGATSGEEDETDLTKVNFMLDRFEAFTKGFLEEVGSSFEKDEIYSLLIGAKVMTLECGIRFLTDYLEGDHYFKIHREHHNLDRARTQFKLVQDMEDKWQELESIIIKFM